MRKQLTILALVALVTGLFSGCIFSPEEDDPVPPAPDGPINDTPENTIARFIWAYENKKAPEYEGLFTGDFAFEFSNSADPALANEWVTGWFKVDEVLAARNLFLGGTNLDGVYQQPATSIDLILAKTQPVDDTEGRDPTKYKVLSTPMDGQIVVPPQPPSTDPTTYVVTNNSHRFYLVRGDAAASLAESQPADSTRWYIWSWKDETVGVPGATVPTSTGGATRATPGQLPATWARVKAAAR